MIAVVFLGLHVLTSVLDTYVSIGWAAVIIPFTSSSRLWVGVGTIALDTMLAVSVSSLLRARMRPGTWRALHWLAYLSWPVAHTFGMGTDAGELLRSSRSVWCASLAVAVAAVWRVRLAARQVSARSAPCVGGGRPAHPLGAHGAAADGGHPRA